MNIKFNNGFKNTYGGAIYWHGSYGNITGCEFNNNQITSNYGGAVYMHGTYGTITDCIFIIIMERVQTIVLVQV